MIPTILTLFSQIPTIVQTVDDLFGGKGRGPEKKSAVMLLLRAGVKGVEIASGRDLVDDEPFIAGIDKAVEGSVQAMNAVYAFKRKAA